MIEAVKNHLFHLQANNVTAYKVAEVLGLSNNQDVIWQMTSYPVKGSLKGTIDRIPSDPTMYRFYEILQIYGLPLKVTQTLTTT